MEQRVALEFEYYYEPFESWFQYSVYPLPDEGIIMYARDITETRKTEEALRKSEQLAAAGRLAASIAHEINNPLEAVTNLLYLASMDGNVNGNSRRLLEKADKELRRLSHIAARSLKFYRQDTAPALCSLEELIESVLFFYETEINMRKISSGAPLPGSSTGALPSRRISPGDHQPDRQCAGRTAAPWPTCGRGSAIDATQPAARAWLSP